MGFGDGADDRAVDGRKKIGAIQIPRRCVSTSTDSLETEIVRQRVDVDLLADMLFYGQVESGRWSGNQHVSTSWRAGPMRGVETPCGNVVGGHLGVTRPA